jgi:probable F420-dependent oxidoreductase
MRIGVTLPSRTGPIAGIADKARRAEQAGFQSIWSYEVYRNPFNLLTVAAAATERATLGTGLAAAFSRSPFEAANAAADIDELSGGRMLFGLGTGVPEFLRAFHSTNAKHPLGRMSEYLDVLRLSWEYLATGTADRFEGEHYRFVAPPVNPWGERDLPRTRIPIGLAAMGPKLVELCGRKADAWLGYFATTKYVEQFVRPHLEIGAKQAGRDPSEVQICAEAVCSVSPDRELAMSRARKQVGFYATHPAGAQVAAMHGLEDAIADLRRGFVAEGIAAFERTDDRIVETLSISGTPEEARQKLAQYEGVIDHLVLHTPYVPPIEAEESEDAFACILDTFGDLARASGQPEPAGTRA